jgi:hypothetical protein
MAVDLALVAGDDPLLADVERSSEQTAHGHDPVSLALRRTIPGGGHILALVRLEEIEEIARVPRGQALVSYGRLVKSARESHGKRHGPSGQKLGKAQLKGAFSAAAVLLRKNNEPAKQDLTKIATRHGQGKALSILAPTRGRAISYMLKHQEAFNPEQLLATEGGRERISLAAHGSHRGQRHTTGASRRATMLVGPEPAPAVPVPPGKPGLLLR